MWGRMRIDAVLQTINERFCDVIVEPAFELETGAQAEALGQTAVRAVPEGGGVGSGGRAAVLGGALQQSHEPRPVRQELRLQLQTHVRQGGGPQELHALLLHEDHHGHSPGGGGAPRLPLQVPFPLTHVYAHVFAAHRDGWMDGWMLTHTPQTLERRVSGCPAGFPETQQRRLLRNQVTGEEQPVPAGVPETLRRHPSGTHHRECLLSVHAITATVVPCALMHSPFALCIYRPSL